MSSVPEFPLSFERFRELVVAARRHFGGSAGQALEVAIHTGLSRQFAGRLARGEAIAEQAILEELQLARAVWPFMRRFEPGDDPHEVYAAACEAAGLRALHAEDEDDPAVIAFYAAARVAEEAAP